MNICEVLSSKSPRKANVMIAAKADMLQDEAWHTGLS
jgi:hypothetical protein